VVPLLNGGPRPTGVSPPLVSAEKLDFVVKLSTLFRSSVLRISSIRLVAAALLAVVLSPLPPVIPLIPS